MARKETTKWLESLKAEIGKPEHRTLWHYAEAIDMAIEALSADTVPIEKYHELQHQFVMLGAIFADLTEVVRCKDCRFWRNEHLCLVMSRYGSIDTKAEHYCSWGERKQNECK